jgi:hypothetical protein
MYGWQIPPPKKSSKSQEAFARERREKVAWLMKKGVLKSERIKQALLKVPREDFIPEAYRDGGLIEIIADAAHAWDKPSCGLADPACVSPWDFASLQPFRTWH